MIDSALFLDELIRRANEQSNEKAKQKLNDPNFIKSVNDVSEILNDLGYLKANVRDEAFNKQNEIYLKISNGLIRNFFTVYYVNVNTGLYIGYSNNEDYKTLKIEENGTDFFKDVTKNIPCNIYSDDQAKMYKALKKDYLISSTNAGNILKVSYRLLLNNIPTHVSLTAMRLTDDEMIIGISNNEEIAKKEMEYQNTIKETLTYTNIALALCRNYFKIFYVNTVTDRYEQYSLDTDTQKLEKVEDGSDFFGQSIINAKKYIYKEDLDKFLYTIKKSNLLNELSKENSINLTYRELINGVPTYVSLRAINLFNDINHIVLAVCNIDDQKRKENEFNRKYEQERVFARTDALTGCYNRNYFSEVEEDINNKIETGTLLEFAAIIFDINDLKIVNDTLGHDVGDQFIRDACNIIKDTFKESLLFRVGGDEFVVLASGNDYKHRLNLISKIGTISKANKSIKKVVIACGHSDFDYKKDKDLQPVLKRADEAMYENKKRLKI